MRTQIQDLGKVAITVEEDYWDINKRYDRLTIVQVKNKFSTYISRIDVPERTSITDRRYWIPFSSLIEDANIDYANFKQDVELKFIENENRLREIEEKLNSIDGPNNVGYEELVDINNKQLVNSRSILAAINSISAKLDKGICPSNPSQGISNIVFGDSFVTIDGKLEVNKISEEDILSTLIDF